MKSEHLAWYIRSDAVEMTHKANSSHIGSILSIADILAVLYSSILKYDCNNPLLEDRDRVILSKGHGGGAMYSVLARVGFFDTSILSTHCADGSNLSGHVSDKGVPGVEISTGSLGHGLPIGVGIALAAKQDKKDFKTFVIVGDGECNEGSIWESALFANQYKLDNLIVIVDHNKMQAMGFCEDILTLEPFEKKWESFGWNTISIDGHNHNQLKNALENAKNNKNNKPSVIIANTIKGKGISFLENKLESHYISPQGEKYKISREDLEKIKPKDMR